MKIEPWIIVSIVSIYLLTNFVNWLIAGTGFAWGILPTTIRIPGTTMTVDSTSTLISILTAKLTIDAQAA